MRVAVTAPVLLAAALAASAAATDYSWAVAVFPSGTEFTLEVAAGQAQAHGLKPGDRITVLSEPEIQ